MSNLTTDSIKYHAEIKRRLTEKFESGWTPVWNYCEMTQLLNYGLSFTFLMKEGLQNRKILFRNWINNINNEAKLGIYNLDNIRIKEEEISFTLDDTFEIQNLIKRDIGTIKNKGIVLDGYDKQFTEFKSNSKFKWNLDEEMNKDLSLLIKKIKKHITKDK